MVTCRRGPAVGAKAPDVQVVDVADALDGLHAGTHLGDGNAAGRAFQRIFRVSRTMAY